MDGEASLSYVEQLLSPSPRPGDTVIMGNLPAHKVYGVREAIQAVGVSLRYLRPHSPDFKPIEMAFSKLKALLRAPCRISGKLDVCARVVVASIGELRAPGVQLHRRLSRLCIIC